MAVPRSPYQQKLRRYRIYGVLCSVLVHAALFLGLVLVSCEPWMLWDLARMDSADFESSFSDAPAPGLPLMDGTETFTAVPAPGAAADTPHKATPLEVSNLLVQQKLAEARAESEAAGTSENLEKLDRLSTKLSQVASAGSVDQIADAFRRWTKTTARAERPAEKPVAGEFDYDTAQFHDVRRYAKEPQGWRYVAVLLDAAGRTDEVEMGDADGEQVFATLERIKANPLLEQVYRQIAMPLLDQMLVGLKQAAKANPPPRAARTKPGGDAPATQNVMPPRTSQVSPK